MSPLWSPDPSRPQREQEYPTRRFASLWTSRPSRSRSPRLVAVGSRHTRSLALSERYSSRPFDVSTFWSTHSIPIVGVYERLCWEILSGQENKENKASLERV